MTLLVLAAIAGACLAVLAPPTPKTYAAPSTRLEDAVSPAHARYSASSLLGIPPAGSQGEGQFAALAFYLKSAQINQAFAQRLHYTGDDPNLVSKLVSARSDPKTATVSVEGYGGTPQQAADVVNAFVATVKSYVSGLTTTTSQQSLADARREVAKLKARIDALGDRIDKLEAEDPKPSRTDPQVSVLVAQHDALIASYIAAYQRYSKLGAGAAPTVALTVLQPATAKDAKAVSPSILYRLPVRIVVGLLLGLAVGAALALLFEQYGRKVSSRANAEALFRAPVLAEVPRRRLASGVLVGRQDTASAAYRMLRAVLMSASTYRGAGFDQGFRPTTTVTLPEPAPAGEPVVVQASSTGAGIGQLSPDPVPAQPRPAGAARRSSAHGGANGAEPVPGANGSAPANGSAATNGSSPHNGRGPDPYLVHNGLGPVGAPVLVVAAPGDERSHPVVVANLAASFAESGWDVTVLRMGSACLPHQDVVSGRHGSKPAVALQDTQVAGVRAGDWVLGDAVPTAAKAVEYVRSVSDLVVVDVGRVESAEFAEVAPPADGVVAVCEIGGTRREAAQQAAEVIDRSYCRFYGVVLTQVPQNVVERFRDMRRRRSPLRARPAGGASWG